MITEEKLGTEIEQEEQLKKLNKQEKLVYCHFSFRRPKNKDYGLFAVAIYKDYEGKQLIAVRTRKVSLWENQQFISAIQSYSNALDMIWVWQSKLLSYNVTKVRLITSNITLHKWILNPLKNKNYSDWMKRAYSPYRPGEKKELFIDVDLGEYRDSEKSYKFCREDLVYNNNIVTLGSATANKKYKLNITEYKTPLDIVAESKPEGLNELGVRGDNEC